MNAAMPRPAIRPLGNDRFAVTFPHGAKAEIAKLKNARPTREWVYVLEGERAGTTAFSSEAALAQAWTKTLTAPKALPLAAFEVDELVARGVADRTSFVRVVRKLLKERTGVAWSVSGGRGTAWGWVTITAAKSRQADGNMRPGDQALLARVLGADSPVHHQGESVKPTRSARAAIIRAICGPGTSDES